MKSMSKGIVLFGPDEVIESRAKKAGLKVEVSSSFELPFDKTLFVAFDTRVPWDLLPSAWHFLERWDAAVPLWRYGETAESVLLTLSATERKLTKDVVRDLRVPLYAVELIFVRKNEAGVELMETYQEECGRGDMGRVAFLRAFYRVKPRLCVLPRSWLAEVRGYDARQRPRMRQRPISAGKPLVTVELEPGRFVKCHEGDEERVRADFERQRIGRG